MTAFATSPSLREFQQLKESSGIDRKPRAVAIIGRWAGEYLMRRKSRQDTVVTLLENAAKALPATKAVILCRFESVPNPDTICFELKSVIKMLVDVLRGTAQVRPEISAGTETGAAARDLSPPSGRPPLVADGEPPSEARRREAWYQRSAFDGMGCGSDAVDATAAASARVVATPGTIVVADSTGAVEVVKASGIAGGGDFVAASSGDLNDAAAVGSVLVHPETATTPGDGDTAVAVEGANNGDKAVAVEEASDGQTSPRDEAFKLCTVAPHLPVALGEKEEWDGAGEMGAVEARVHEDGAVDGDMPDGRPGIIRLADTHLSEHVGATLSFMGADGEQVGGEVCSVTTDGALLTEANEGCRAARGLRVEKHGLQAEDVEKREEQQLEKVSGKLVFWRAVRASGDCTHQSFIAQLTFLSSYIPVGFLCCSTRDEAVLISLVFPMYCFRCVLFKQLNGIVARVSRENRALKVQLAKKQEKLNVTVKELAKSRELVSALTTEVEVLSSLNKNTMTRLEVSR